MSAAQGQAEKPDLLVCLPVMAGRLKLLWKVPGVRAFEGFPFPVAHGGSQQQTTAVGSLRSLRNGYIQDNLCICWHHKLSWFQSGCCLMDSWSWQKPEVLSKETYPLSPVPFEPSGSLFLLRLIHLSFPLLWARATVLNQVRKLDPDCNKPFFCLISFKPVLVQDRFPDLENFAFVLNLYKNQSCAFESNSPWCKSP